MKKSMRWCGAAIANPMPRWSTIAAAKLGIAAPGKLPVSIQERAWSSPIWYQRG